MQWGFIIIYRIQSIVGDLIDYVNKKRGKNADDRLPKP